MEDIADLFSKNRGEFDGLIVYSKTNPAELFFTLNSEGYLLMDEVAEKNRLKKEPCRSEQGAKPPRFEGAGRVSEEGSPSSSTKQRKIDVVIPIEARASTATSPLLPTPKKTTEEGKKKW